MQTDSKQDFEEMMLEVRQSSIEWALEDIETIKELLKMDGINLLITSL
jgi:hypothetical protein